MIPKIIHYCWMSNEPIPENIQKYIETWKEKLPDYKIKKWSYENFPRGKSKWVDQAFDAKKYAFVADYIRNYALYNEGGIYFDSDVEVLKSLDDFLSLPYFFGKESAGNTIEAAVMGAEKGYSMFKEALDYYDMHDFLNSDGSFNIITMPNLYNLLIANSGIGKRYIKNLSEFKHDDKFINIFPEDFFCPKDSRSGIIRKTNNTYTIHHFSGSWMNHNSLKYKIHQLKKFLISKFGEDKIMKYVKILKND